MFTEFMQNKKLKVGKVKHRLLAKVASLSFMETDLNRGLQSHLYTERQQMW